MLPDQREFDTFYTSRAPIRGGGEGAVLGKRKRLFLLRLQAVTRNYAANAPQWNEAWFNVIYVAEVSGC